MDCVGCEKCRLWGKLQVLGLGTALKILFSVDGGNHLPVSDSVVFRVKYGYVIRECLRFSPLIFQLQLQRNEVIALVNLLHRLSESVKLVHEKGPYVEKIVGQVSGIPLKASTLQRLWQSVNDFR